MRRLVTEVGLRCAILPEPISIDEIGLSVHRWILGLSPTRTLHHFRVRCEGTMEARSESRRYSRQRVSRNLPVLVSFMAPRHDQLANDHRRTRRNVFVVAGMIKVYVSSVHLGRVVADPDITPVSGYVRVGGDSPGTRKISAKSWLRASAIWREARIPPGHLGVFCY
jgi:hypothetical protein